MLLSFNFIQQKENVNIIKIWFVTREKKLLLLFFKVFLKVNFTIYPNMSQNFSDFFTKVDIFFQKKQTYTKKIHKRRKLI